MVTAKILKISAYDQSNDKIRFFHATIVFGIKNIAMFLYART